MIEENQFEREVLTAEWYKYLRHRRHGSEEGNQEHREPDESWKNILTGLAISGGGIRSAAFSLGILQQLAARKLLGKFDYLSTVSGGGYTGGSVSYFANRDGYNLHDKFPYGPPNGWEKPSKALRYLRSHGSYLTPGDGINSRSLAGVVIRAVLLNLLIWLPILTLAIATIQRIVLMPGTGWPGMLPWANSPVAWIGIGIAVLSLAILRILTRKTQKPAKGLKRSSLIPLRTAIWGVFTIAVVLTASAVIFAFPDLPRATLPPTTENSLVASVLNLTENVRTFRQVEVPLLFKVVEFAAAAFLIAYLVLMIGYSVLTFKTQDQDAYHRRRRHAMWYARLLQLIALLAAVAVVPYLTYALSGTGGALALASGIAVGIWKLQQQAAKWISLEALAPLLALLVLGGMFVLAYGVAYHLTLGWGSMYLLFVAAALSTVLGYLVNLNQVSIGRYYRDRLMEAFMPSDEMLERNRNGLARDADNLELHRLARDGKPVSPLHIVNTNVVLVDSGNRIYQKRGGDSFVFTPLHVGSAATTWVETWRYYKAAFTLPTAVAISGAAVNPNAGPAGGGLTRNRSISFLMSLLNIRLGYWAPNPLHPFARVAMNHFWSAWYELSPKAGYREDSTFVQLSDGGHFDNLGLYELFRRRVRFILVLDGGQDADFQFQDLQHSLHLAEQDFKVRVTFDGRGVDDLIPQKQDRVAFPRDLKLAKSGFIRGEFTYADRPDMGECQIYLIKTTLIDGMSMRTLGYKGAHPDFPDETTADQFFDEDQFDAYRLLGSMIANRMVDDSAERFGEELQDNFSSVEVS